MGKNRFSAPIPPSGCSLQLLVWGSLRTDVQDAPSWPDAGNCREEIQRGKSLVLPLCFAVTVGVSLRQQHLVLVFPLFDAGPVCGYFHQFPGLGEFAVATLTHFFTLSVAIHGHVFFFMISKTHTSSLGQAPYL